MYGEITCSNELQNSKYLVNTQEISENNNNTRKSKTTLYSIIKNIFSKFNIKYNHMSSRYDINIIDNIIYNEKSHIVSIFKDLLINDDLGDYLKRYYTKKESKERLPKYFEYYNLYSKIFPNYTSIPEGKYFYINIQRKQRMIDLQEKMENENQIKREEYQKNKLFLNKNGKNYQNEKVFNTSVVNSILNKTNKEVIEILFDINVDNNKKNENLFIEDVNKLINLINKYDIKEDNLIDYNFESKNNKKKENKAIISPLMNININYFNINKLYDNKNSSISMYNKSNKNKVYLNKLFNLPIKNSKNKNNKEEKELDNNKNIYYKDYSLFINKINQIKNNRNIFNNMNNNKKKKNKNKSLSMNMIIKNKNNYLNCINKKNDNSKSKRKNNSIIYENKNKSFINNLKKNKEDNSYKNIFSYRGLLGALSSNNYYDNPKLFLKAQISSTNKNLYDNIENNKDNFSSTCRNHKNKYIFNNRNKDILHKDNISIISSTNSNLYKLFNYSRNKINLSNKLKTNNISNKQSPIKSLSPHQKEPLIIRQKKKINNLFFYKTIMNKNNIENSNNKTIFKEKILMNNLVNDNINNYKNNSLLISKNNSNNKKTNRTHHSYSTKRIKKSDIENINNNKKIKGKYLNNYLKAFDMK